MEMQLTAQHPPLASKPHVLTTTLQINLG